MSSYNHLSRHEVCQLSTVTFLRISCKLSHLFMSYIFTIYLFIYFCIYLFFTFPYILQVVSESMFERRLFVQ